MFGTDVVLSLFRSTYPVVFHVEMLVFAQIENRQGLLTYENERSWSRRIAASDCTVP